MHPNFLFIAVLAGTALGQQSAYGQCGGQGYTGPSTCVSGYSCVLVNQWYSQCQPGTTQPTTTQPTTTKPTTLITTSSSSATATPGKGKFKWLGVDESVAEWGTAFPGVAGKDYTFPSTATIGVRRTDMELLLAAANDVDPHK